MLFPGFNALSSLPQGSNQHTEEKILKRRPALQKDRLQLFCDADFGTIPPLEGHSTTSSFSTLAEYYAQFSAPTDCRHLCSIFFPSDPEIFQVSVVDRKMSGITTLFLFCVTSFQHVLNSLFSTSQNGFNSLLYPLTKSENLCCQWPLYSRCPMQTHQKQKGLIPSPRS